MPLPKKKFVFVMVYGQDEQLSTVYVSCIHIFPNNVHSISMVTCSLAACDLQHCDDTGCHGSHVTMTESKKRDLTEIHPNHGHLGVGFSRALRICFYLLFLLLLLDILNAVQDCRIFGFSFD